MRFVEYTTIERHIPMSFRQKVSASGVFAALEEAAAIIIRDTTGIAFPSSTSNTPDWIILPAAHIIAYLAVNEFASVDEVTLKYIDTNYTRALKTLADKSAEIDATPTTDGSTGKYSSITQQGVWE